MTKVLMVSHLFPPKFGGAVIQSMRLSRALGTLGIKPDYFTDNDSARSRWDVFEGHRVFRCRTFLTGASEAKQLLYTLRLLGFLIRHREYRIIHFHALLGFETLIFPLLRLMGRRLIVKLTLVGSDDPVTLGKRKLGPLFLACLKRADRLIAISNMLAELSLKSGFQKEKVLLIPNGVDGDRYLPASPGEKEALKAKLGFGGHQTIFFSMGKVEERKGYDHLLAAWQKIQDEFPSASLIIGGPGNEPANAFYSGLTRMIADKGLRGVHFIGEVKNAPDLFRIADCFLFCSRQEGFGTVLVEAMFCGIPVVATNIEGVTEGILTEPEIGRIVFSGSPEAFADMVIRLMRETTPERLALAVKRVRERFDIRSVARRYQTLYSELAA